MASILNDTKKVLGLAPDDTTFDVDVIMHINSVISTLAQLGVGPLGGFEIEDATAMWSDLLGTSPRFNEVKSYVYLRVRLLFDPPQTGYLVEAFDRQIKELEWRINVERESTDWVDPDPDPISEDDDVVIDGGGP